MSNVQFEVDEDHNEEGENRMDVVSGPISNAANGVDSLLRKRSNSQVDSDEEHDEEHDEELSEEHEGSRSPKYYKIGDQYGGASELKDGDIIVGKQNPDGTIEYMLYSDYFKLVFGIVSKPNEEISKPRYTALGVPVPQNPVTDFKVGDWVPADKATALESRFTLVSFIKNGINGYILKAKAEPGLQNLDFSYSNPEELIQYSPMSSPMSNLGGSKRTRRQIKKTCKKKTRKHKKIKHKKYTRPYKLKIGRKNTYKKSIKK